MHQQDPTPFISAVQIISITKQFDKLFCAKSLSDKLLTSTEKGTENATFSVPFRTIHATSELATS